MSILLTQFSKVPVWQRIRMAFWLVLGRKTSYSIPRLNLQGFRYFDGIEL